MKQYAVIDRGFGYYGIGSSRKVIKFKNLFLISILILSMCNNPVEQVTYIVDYSDKSVNIDFPGVITFIANTPQRDNFRIQQYDEYDLTITLNYQEEILIVSHPIIEDFEIIKIILRGNYSIDTLKAKNYRR